MTAKEAKRAISINNWKTIFEDKAKYPDMNVDDYCIQNNLSRNSYYYWLRILRNESLSQTNSIVEVNVPVTTGYMPVETTSFNSDEHSSLTIKVCGIDVLVTDNTSPTLLAKTIGVIRNVG